MVNGSRNLSKKSKLSAQMSMPPTDVWGFLMQLNRIKLWTKIEKYYSSIITLWFRQYRIQNSLPAVIM